MIEQTNTQIRATGFPYVFWRGPWVDAGFWLVHFLFWHIIFSPETFAPTNLAISFVLTFWQVVATYGHHYFLLRPRGEGRLSIPAYALGVLLFLGACSTLSGLSIFTFFTTLLGESATANFLQSFWNYWVGAILGGMGMAVALTGAIFLFGRRRDQEKREHQLEHARTQAELAYLRGQLNPHFLFNALNSIYVLIPRSPDQAQEALGGFSDLLRYQLYRSEQALVPVAEELDHLNQFVGLNRLRLEEDFVFNLQVTAAEGYESHQHKIPPLLLLPLVENALKYCPKEGGDVNGILVLQEEKLLFTLTNNLAKEVIAKDPEAGGIGLANIRRRLALLYPDQHRLETLSVTDHYTVTLEIPLT